MQCLQRKLLALAAFALLTFFPNVSFAATQKSCECFCGEVGKGAMDMDSLTHSACTKLCSDTNTTFVGCFASPAEYPSESDKCWTQAECAAWSAEDRNGDTLKADWGGTVPVDCSPTKTSQTEMRYCYGKDVPYTLNIAIGSVTKVENLPVYINTIYNWLLPAAALVAVVMMMIGGLQYVLSRGKEKYITKSKERITNAITGIVLLLSIFVILNLIDPRLTSLDSLKVPLVKEVTILSAESSCERLSDVGYGVDPDPDKTNHYCGEKGKINDISELKDNAIGSWKVGDPCDFQTCAMGEGFTCLSTGVCASCAENPTPTVSTCSAIQKLDTGFDGETHIYCSYDAETNSCLGVEAKVGNGNFYCPSLQALQSTSDDNKGCEYYETLKIVTRDGSESIATEKGKDLLKEICTNDPCKLADEVNADHCAYNEGADVTEWFWGAYTTVEDGFYCHTF